jgi:hypothetical protein
MNHALGVPARKLPSIQGVEEGGFGGNLHADGKYTKFCAEAMPMQAARTNLDLLTRFF